MAVTLVLRFADVGIATYASLRVVGEPARTVTWVVQESDLVAALDQLSTALPDPRASETRRDAVERAIATGPFAAPATELAIARTLGAQLLAPEAWQLLTDCVASPRAALFVSPSARLARVPWGLLAMPERRRLSPDGTRGRADGGAVEHRPLGADTGGLGRSPRRPAAVDSRSAGARPAPRLGLGSVLGRPSAETALAQHFTELMRRRAVLPDVSSAVELFRRTDADRPWLGRQLDRQPSRLLYVGHATAADGDVGHADRAALHLADERPLTAADLMSAKLPMPPRIAMMACASGGDYQFDEATGWWPR